MKHLSRFDIEAIAAKYVKAYMELPDVRNTKIYRIDPELLLEKVLGLTVEYQHLSYDGSILGMTSFTELGVQVLEDDDNEAFFFLDGKTVLVEKDLAFDNKLRGRKNFTLMQNLILSNEDETLNREVKAYQEKLTSKTNEIPIWERQWLTIEEASEYSGIARRKLRELSNTSGCPFAIWMGNKIHIIREKLDRYTETHNRI